MSERCWFPKPSTLRHCECWAITTTLKELPSPTRRRESCIRSKTQESLSKAWNTWPRTQWCRKLLESLSRLKNGYKRLPDGSRFFVGGIKMAQDAFEYRIEIDSEGVDEAIEKVDVLNDHLKQTIELVDQLNLKGVEVRLESKPYGLWHRLFK